MDLYKLLKNPVGLIDSHCHLPFESPEILQSQIAKAKAKNISQIWNVSVNLKTSTQSMSIESEIVKSFIGIDPEVFIPGSELFMGLDLDEMLQQSYESLKKIILQNRSKVIGIGETGLDYYWLNNSDLSSEFKNKSKLLQKRLFEIQLELASELNLPLTIHSRGAEEECLRVVKKYNTKGVFHSYTGDYNTAVKILDAGWGLGINGIITFKNALELRQTYKKILTGKKLSTPEDYYRSNIYFETDSPYLAPEGKRGTTNEPANVSDIFESMGFLQYHSKDE